MANVTMVVRLLIQIALIAAGLWLTLDHAMTAGAMIASSLIWGAPRAVPADDAYLATIVTARTAYDQLSTFCLHHAPNARR
jgi:ABC-type protease/lipase transport system fused ATPase/permease subunit